MQNLWLIIVVFFLLILIIPIFTKVNVSYDILNNSGAITINIFFIKVVAYKIRIKDGQIVLFTHKDKKEIEIKVSQKQLRFLKQLTVQFKEKIVIKNLTFQSAIGGDAYVAGVGTGLFNIIVTSFMGYLKTSKKSANYQVINRPDFKNECLTFQVIGTCFITLIDIIYSLIMSVIIVRRSEKYERV